MPQALYDRKLLNVFALTEEARKLQRSLVYTRQADRKPLLASIGVGLRVLSLVVRGCYELRFAA